MSFLLPQFKCSPDTFAVFKFQSHSYVRSSKGREAINIRTQCILSITSTSTPTVTATSTVLDLEKLQLSPLEAIPNSVPADRSWTTPTTKAKTTMLDLEKIPSLDTHSIPIVANKPLTYVGAVGPPSEMAVALAWPPLPPPPSQVKFSIASRPCCRCSSTILQSDSISSPPTTSTTHRPAVILPGLGNNTNDYQELALILKDYGVPTLIANVSRIDWLRNAAGLLDSNYWRGTLRPRPVLDWYLKRVEEALNEAKELAQGSKLSLIGHSAGGWLARVYLQEFGISDVSLLLTLGTPHLAPPKGISGAIDQTRGLLDYVEKNCAKAVYTPELRYVCIAGRYIQGARLLEISNDDNHESSIEIEQPVGKTMAINTLAPPSITLQARFVGQGYKQVCGQADVWGDGVVPEMSAHLEGALNISLDGVYHSPVGSNDETRPWYGSPAVVQKWIHHLLN